MLLVYKINVYSADYISFLNVSCLETNRIWFPARFSIKPTPFPIPVVICFSPSPIPVTLKIATFLDVTSHFQTYTMANKKIVSFFLLSCNVSFLKECTLCSFYILIYKQFKVFIAKMMLPCSKVIKKSQLSFDFVNSQTIPFSTYFENT